MTLSTQPYYQIQGVIQHYDWGLSAKESLAAKLHGGSFDDASPCAELWLGVHPKGEATLIGTENPGNPLSAMLTPEHGSLPFLLKVLSIQRALSIQLHPSLQEAARLHARDPHHYPDANHKPEMAFALTDDVYLLYGFRSKKDIQAFMQRFPEFKSCIHRDSLTLDLERLDELSYKEAVYKALLECPDTIIEAQCTSLYKRLESETSSKLEYSFIQSLIPYFPKGDHGIMTFFVHNVIHLPKGEALFIGPHVPHAYLSGQLIECMANSDNVIRAGLTSKFKDVPELLSLADCFAAVPAFLEKEGDESGYCFRPPVEEFELCFIEHCRGQINPRGSHALGLVFEGEGTLSGNLVEAGFAFYIPAHGVPLPYELDAGRMVIARVPQRES